MVVDSMYERIVKNAKKYFSNPNGMVYLKWKDYIAGEVLRQDYLETALGWIADGEILGGKEMSPDADPIADYMGRHQKDSDATELPTELSVFDNMNYLYLDDFGCQVVLYVYYLPQKDYDRLDDVVYGDVYINREHMKEANQ